MDEMGIAFVSDKLIQRINDIYKTFSSYQLFALDLLLKFYNHTSISLPILWVADKINSYELQYTSPFLEGEKETDEFTKKEILLINFYVQRLDNLKQLLILNK